MTDQSGHAGELNEKVTQAPSTKGDGNLGGGEKASSAGHSDETGRAGDKPPFQSSANAPASTDNHGGRSSETPPFQPKKSEG